MGEEMCCGCTSLNADDEYDMGMHVAAIFIVFIVAGTGSMVPIISRMIPQSKANSVIMESVSAFSYGVVVATALIHMISEGIEKLSSECLGPIVEEYESWGLAIVMITLLIMHLIECESTVFFGDEGSAHGHGPSNGEDTVILGENLPSPHSVNHPYQKKSMDEGDGSSKLSRKIATLIFEAGVIFHSVIIGVNLGVASGPGFKTLLAALSFHQFFEGIAIGSSALKTVESKSKLLTVNFAFALTTPAGLGFGILVRNSYSKSSTTALWVEGVLACVAGGILLYTGIVELLTYNMTTNGQFMSRPTAQRFTLYFSMWAGAGVMALLGKWA
ncbi:hypothetical protein CCR75_009815 [Bremia lactucae]|uniref:Zinc transporter n=1 Tax=Bremia lactucae TaxID=4779 RepID=A0A976IKL1_BRELC|nr:hypothetical protein CCR75_009815 [Bremia lactucae]